MPDVEIKSRGVMAASADPENAPISRLKRRRDFLRAAKGLRWHGKAFSLQAVSRDAGSDPTASPISTDTGSNDTGTRAGLTVTKKVGNAVVRNRARRRLREALRLTPALPVKPGHDYVLIARIEAVRAPFAALQSELARAIRGVHAEGRPPSAGKRPNRTRPRA